MTFSKLIERISEEYNIDILSQEENSEIQNVAFLDGRQNSAAKNTLYFGYDKQLAAAKSFPVHCILAGTGENVLPFSLEGNAALVPENSLFSIFNDIKTLVESTRNDGIYTELTALADETRTIESVIEAASVKLGNSLLFCDMNFKILASSDSYPVPDPLWIENTKRGYCGYEFINGVKSMQCVRNTPQTTAAVEVTCPISPYRKLASKVFHNQTQIGFLLTIEGENPFLPFHFEMLSIISHALSYTITCYTPGLFEGTGLYHDLLYEMLIGAPLRDIQPRLKKLRFPSRMQVIFLRPAKYMGQQHLNSLACKSLKTSIPGILVTCHKKGIVGIIPLDEEENPGPGILEKLKALYQKEPMQIGISNCFTDMETFVRHYEQALAALEMGQKLGSEEPVCFYQDYQIFHLLSEVKDAGRLERFCHPALAVLKQYDRENSSQLYKTLCVFIEKGCNIKLASESLYIHRNSLAYRLNRITGLCQLDLADINTLFLLRLSYFIDRYTE
jgi:hypothetical protein